MEDSQYDLAVVGTGFAATFFLKTWLRHAPATARAVVLERGGVNAASAGRTYQDEANVAVHDTKTDEYITNLNPAKVWVQRIGFGGGTCWTGNTPRMHPTDFRTRTLYGVGEDWPISYEQLEPYYAEVEQIMGIAGEPHAAFPRSLPYPLPPHRLNALDRELARKYPGQYTAMPCARASRLGAGRAVCCANGVCDACPVAAKFQVDFHMRDVYADERVELITDANVTHLDVEAGTVRRVSFIHEARERSIRCDLAAIGANGIMSPFILLTSGLGGPLVGKYLNEQVAVDVDVFLDGVQNYDGSTIVTGLGLMGLDGPFRGERPGYILENWNLPWLRAEQGRWREKGFLRLVFEELPQLSNEVTLSAADPLRPQVNYRDHSDYAKRALADADHIIMDLLDGLPVESYSIRQRNNLGREGHVQGTTRMGSDPATSVVDAGLVHHEVRNLLVLGSGTFPTCPAANPTLSLSALACRAADKLMTSVQ